ncbi:integrase catalytic domain-containing protein [Trichonephila clavipes]|nr:integrase catalytic domain-containing protein [Trichonephila clavipes]
MIGTTFRDRKIQQTFPLEDAAWMFWQNQNGGKALIGSEVLQKTGRSKKFILTLKSLTLKKKRQSLPPPIRRQTNLNSSMTAVHLELITSLSTDSFILAFRRFIARRGRPTTIYSDNGKNFVGTFNALNSIDWDKIQDFALKIKIQWKFSPPSAPWWGGFWERLVGMLKNVLRKVLGKASLNEEELNTLLCDAESIINSRPITYLSEDPKDLVALTPAMFLQEIREIGVPDFDMIDSRN